jgi:transcriptional regulator with XRE-family HTH domain
MDRQFNKLRNAPVQNGRARPIKLALSQEQLAFKAEIDRTYVGQIELSTVNSSLMVLYRIAHALVRAAGGSTE